MSDVVKLEESSCARYLHVSSGCSRCIDVCPAGALGISDGLLVLDEGKCSGCGRCAAQCPTGALTPDGAGSGMARKIVAAKGSGTAVSFACNRAGRKDGAVEVRCLAGLEVHDLLFGVVAGVKSYGFVCGGCDDCPHAAGCPVDPAAQGNAAADIVRSLGGTLECAVEVRGGGSDLAKRRFFAGLWRKGDLPKIRKVEPTATTVSTLASPEERKAPVKRTVLLSAIKVLRERFKANETVKFAELAVEGRAVFAVPDIDFAKCSACGLCAEVCPTGALRRSEEDGRAVFTIDKGACVSCGLCRDVCYLNAVALRPVQSPSELEIGARVPMGSRASDDSIFEEVWEDKISKMFDCPVYRT